MVRQLFTRRTVSDQAEDSKLTKLTAVLWEFPELTKRGRLMEIIMADQNTNSEMTTRDSRVGNQVQVQDTGAKTVHMADQPHTGRVPAEIPVESKNPLTRSTPNPIKAQERENLLQAKNQAPQRRKQRKKNIRLTL